MSEITLEQAAYWSNFQKLLVQQRAKGIYVSMKNLKAGMNILEPEINNLKTKIRNKDSEITSDVLDSPKQLGDVLYGLKYKLQKSPTGQWQVDKYFLENNAGDELIDLIAEYREANKIYNDFFLKIYEMQQWTCPEALVDGAEYGMVFPEMNLFGAQTGRFSSSCPNIQQIPKRSEKWGSLARSIFVPRPGTKWYSLDWSNQEGRLQVHYAYKINSPGAEDLKLKFDENPKLDLHQTVADIAKINRTQAKTINLGLSYGMGQGKLCWSLGLPTKWISWKGKKVEVAGDEAKAILDQYHTYMPYLKDLTSKVTNSSKIKGHITTLGGRKLKHDPEKPYKALNKLIQGSAADQCLLVYEKAVEQGLDIICLVHDEFNIQGSENDANDMRFLMENVVELEVPMIAEVKEGDNWGNLGGVK